MTNDLPFEIDNQFKNFRRFLNYLKAVEFTEKVEKTLEVLESNVKVSTAKTWWFLTILALQTENLCPSIERALEKHIEKETYAKTSTLTCKQAAKVFLGQVDFASLENNFSEIDCKICLLLAGGKLQKRKLYPANVLLETYLGTKSHVLLNELKNPSVCRIDKIAGSIGADLEQLAEGTIESFSRCANFSSNHLLNVCDKWVCIWLSQSFEPEPLSKFQKLQIAGVNFTDEFDQLVTHVFMDKNTDVSEIAQLEDLNKKCEFVFV